jgi:hypothetical protein
MTNADGACPLGPEGRNVVTRNVARGLIKFAAARSLKLLRLTNWKCDASTKQCSRLRHLWKQSFAASKLQAAVSSPKCAHGREARRAALRRLDGNNSKSADSIPVWLTGRTAQASDGATVTVPWPVSMRIPTHSIRGRIDKRTVPQKVSW